MIPTPQSMGLLQDRHAAVFILPDNSAFWSTYEDYRSDPLFPAILAAGAEGLDPSALKCARGYYSFGYKPDASSAAND